MTELYILVEGKTDKMFLECYRKHLNIKAEIDYTGGYTHLKNKAFEVKQKIDEGCKVLIIFDADAEGKGKVKKSGYDNMQKYIREELRKEGIEPDSYSVFLFPNNQDDGCFENLLEKMINPEHKGILACFDEFKECLEDKNKDYYVPNPKAKMYTYISSQNISNTKREKLSNDYLYGNKNYWDLDCDYLKSLKDFLLQHSS